MMDVIDESSLLQESSAAEKARETEEKSDPRPEASNNFEFLTFTDFKQTVDSRTKRKVRSHVMHRFHRTAKSQERPQRRGVIVLDTSSLFEPPAPQQGQALAFATLPGPSTMGAGRSNPFGNYPIPMNLRTQHLYDHCKHHLRTLSASRSRVLLIKTQCAEISAQCSEQ
jgi:hypothetical protein